MKKPKFYAIYELEYTDGTIQIAVLTLSQVRFMAHSLLNLKLNNIKLLGGKDEN